MSSCIEFCGKGKKKNQKLEGDYQPMKSQIQVVNKSREDKVKK